MVYKTIARAAYGNITIDSQKIDDDYVRLKKAESTYFEQVIEEEIKENANQEFIDVSDFEEIGDDIEEEIEEKDTLAKAMTKAQANGETPF